MYVKFTCPQHTRCRPYFDWFDEYLLALLLFRMKFLIFLSPLPLIMTISSLPTPLTAFSSPTSKEVTINVAERYEIVCCIMSRTMMMLISDHVYHQYDHDSDDHDQDQHQYDPDSGDQDIDADGVQG